MTPEDFIKEFRKHQEAERQKVKPQHQPQVEKPPTCECGLAMIKRFGHGLYYCPICNIYERDIEVKAKKQEGAKKAASEAIWAEIMADSSLRFAKVLATKIMAEHGFEAKVIFLNRKWSECRQRSDGSFVIIFGYEQLRTAIEEGFIEYKTWRHLWEGNLTCLKAVWATTLHEAAHAIQIDRKGMWYRSKHNNSWATAVRDLQILYPFEEVHTL